MSSSVPMRDSVLETTIAWTRPMDDEIIDRTPSLAMRPMHYS